MNSDLVLLFDTETTGLDPANDQVIEVACALYSLDAAAPVESYSSLIYAESNAAESINGIPTKLLLKAPEPEYVWPRVGKLFEAASMIIAHNGAFDHRFTPEAIRDIRPWLCSQNDITWPKRSKSQALIAIAINHGVGVVHAHRAATDVDILSRLLTRVAETGTNLHELLGRAQTPKVKVRANVSYADRDKAKTAGFAWDGPSKMWWRMMTEDDAKELPFPFTIMKEGPKLLAPTEQAPVAVSPPPAPMPF